MHSYAKMHFKRNYSDRSALFTSLSILWRWVSLIYVFFVNVARCRRCVKWRIDNLSTPKTNDELKARARITASSSSTREDINAQSTRRANVDTYVTIRSFLCKNKHQLLLLNIAFCPHPWQDAGGCQQWVLSTTYQIAPGFYDDLRIVHMYNFWMRAPIDGAIWYVKEP